MRQILLVVGIGTLAGWLALAQQATKSVVSAPQAPKPAPTKIAVVDFIRAVSETAEGKKEFAAVQTWVTKQNEELKKLESEYNALRNRYMQEQLKLNLEARADMERQIQERETKLRRQQEDLNQVLAERRQALVNRLGVKMQQVVQQYAQQNNYLAILVAQEGMFAYVAPVADLTEQMIKLYDAKYPAVAKKP
ncbi:MAG: OmpH family outer membrane protein [Acidobacteria bacterium]|nr:OmpH family outer membrane protein [Acidobacteriota bacterium]